MAATVRVNLLAAVLAGLSLLGAAFSYAVVWIGLFARRPTNSPVLDWLGLAALLLTPLFALAGAALSRRSPSLRPAGIACLIGGAAWSLLFVGLAVAFWWSNR